MTWTGFGKGLYKYACHGKDGQELTIYCLFRLKTKDCQLKLVRSSFRTSETVLAATHSRPGEFLAEGCCGYGKFTWVEVWVGLERGLLNR